MSDLAYQEIQSWRARNGLPPLGERGGGSRGTPSGNSLTVLLKMPAEAVESFANAVSDLPEGIRGTFVRKAVNRFSTTLRASMRDGAKTYTRSGALARSMVKKTIYYPNGTVVILAGPSRRFVTFHRNPRGIWDWKVVPWRYAHLVEFGTKQRHHLKGRRGIYMPWKKATYLVRGGKGRKTRLAGQSTGKVVGGLRITMSLRSRVPEAMASLSTDVNSEFRKWWAKQAPSITKGKYIPNSLRTVTGSVDI